MAKKDKKIPKKIGAIFGETGKTIPDDKGKQIVYDYKKIFVMYENGETEEFEYNSEQYDKLCGLIDDVMDDKKFSSYNDLTDNDIFVKINELDKEKVDEFIEEFEAFKQQKKEEEKKDEEETTKSKAWLRPTAVGLGLLAVGGSILGLSQCSRENEHKLVINDNTTPEDLLNELNKDSIEYKFYKSSIDMFRTFNGNTHKDGIFKLNTDGEQRLNMTFDEAVAFMALSGNYSPDELTKIFGSDMILYQDALEDSYKSLYSKLSIYSMNAKKASGISEFIQNPESKVLWEKIENSIIEYNNNPTEENANKIIANYYDGYIVDSSPIKSSNVDVASAHLINSMVHGHSLSVLEQSHLVSTDILPAGIALVNIVDMDGNVVKTGLTEMVGKSACLENVQIKAGEIAEMVNHNSKVNKALNSLVADLEDEGLTNIANSVRANRGLTPEIQKEIGDAEAQEVLDKYYNAILKDGIGYNEFIIASNNDALRSGMLDEMAITKNEDLINNRTFGRHFIIEDRLEQADQNSNDKIQDSPLKDETVLDKEGIVNEDEFNKLDPEDKQEVIDSAINEGTAEQIKPTVIVPQEEEKITEEEAKDIIEESQNNKEDIPVVNEQGNETYIDDNTAENSQIKADLELEGRRDAADVFADNITVNGNFLDLERLDLTTPSIDTISGNVYDVAVKIAATSNSTIEYNGGDKLTADDSRINAVIYADFIEDYNDFNNSLNGLSDSTKRYLTSQYGTENWEQTLDVLRNNYRNSYNGTIDDILDDAHSVGLEEYQNYQKFAKHNQANDNNNYSSSVDVTPNSQTPSLPQDLEDLFESVENNTFKKKI